MGLNFAGLLAGGRKTFGETRIFLGWGVTVFIFTVASALGPFSFHWYFLGVMVLAALGFLTGVYRSPQTQKAATLRIFILGLPVAFLIAAMVPTQWDDLTQWLPNARYLVEHNAFPGPGLPESPSNFPAYPYGLPVLVYLSSVIAGGFTENAGPIYNLFFTLLFGVAVFRMIKHGYPEDDFDIRRWGVCAIAALFVTALNPTWITRLTFSSYSDVGTSMAFGLTAGLAWLSYNALASGEDREANLFAWQAGLAACAVVGLRQANLVLIVLLAISVLWLMIVEKQWRWRINALVLGRLVLAPVAVWLAWRWQVETRIGGGEFSFRALEAWNTNDLGAVLSKMFTVATNKGGYFLLMLGAVFLGTRTLIKRDKAPFARLCVIAAILFVGYNLFLLIAYLGAFTRTDALRAASYWRYNSHLGGVCLLFIAASAQAIFRMKSWRAGPVLKWAGPIAVILVLAAPAQLSKKLRFDIHPRYAFARDVGKELKEILSPRDRLMLVDPADDGQYLTIMKYMMYGSAEIPVTSTSWNDQDSDRLRELLNLRKITHVWTYGSPQKVATALKVRLSSESASLLHYRDGAWRTIREWPAPEGHEKDTGKGK